MLAERKRIQLAKQTAAKKGAAPKKVKPKPEWNNYLTDDDRFKADQKSILLKKKLLVSQNNIFVSNGDVSLGIKPRHKPIVITSAPSVMPSPANKTMPSKEVNALDLIISAKDKEIGRKSNVPTNGRVGRSMSAHRITRDDGRMEKENLDLDNDRSDGNRIAIEWMGRNASDVNSAHSREIARERREFLLSNSPDDSPANQSSLSVGSMGGKTNKSIRNPSPMKRSSIITTANSLNSPAKATNSRMNTTVSSDGTAASPVKRVKNITEDKDYDLVYVADEIRSLFSELKYYEELSGRRSILDTREELDTMLHDEALLDPQSHKPVMRYLVQLVCQSMTYLLKSEVDLQDERKRYEQLSAKFETLNSLLAPDSAVPNIADFAPIAASSASFTAPFSAPQISAEHDTSGIAFEQHDLYPQPVWADHSRQFVSSQEHSQYEEYSGIASSSSTSSALRSLAQQYAQDAYYPVPGDRDDDEEVEKVQQSGVYASLDRARAGAGAGGSAGTHANPPYAQYTSTPARFQEKMIAGASIAAGKGAKLAANPVPGAMLTTPMQAQDGRSNLHHAYNSVSSTCSTPPMSLLHKKFVYSTANMLPPPSTQESAQKMHPFAHITSPKPYVDAYVSYLQSAPALGSEQQRSTSSTSAVASADLSTPKKGNPVTSHAAASAMLLGQTDSHSSETDDSTMSAGLSRLDELIRYSKSIANTSYTVGDEFSTIARLTNHHSGGAADDSILHSPDSTYLQQTQAQSPRPLAADSVNVYQHMYSSRESEFSLPPPPPPPPSSLPCGDVLEKHGAPLRQPDAASASRLHLQQQQQQQYLSVQQKVPIISTSSVLAANPNSALAANMTGASPSDWLFHNFTAKPVPPSVSHAHSEQHKSASDSLPITPEGVFSPPSSAQQQSVGMVTPSRDFIKVNVPAPQPTVNLKTGAINTKLRSPATRDLFNQQQAGSGGSTGSDSRFHTHDDASTTDETVNRLAEQTSHLFAPDVSPALAPRAAVPPYLLEQQQMQKKKSAQIKIAKPVQSIVHRNPSPCKKSAVPKRVTLSASARSPQQEQTSIIMPHSKVPSPQSAPIHPYAGSSHSLAHQTYQQKLQSLQGEMEESNRSNETTPVLKLNRWAPPALVFDATSGSF